MAITFQVSRVERERMPLRHPTVHGGAQRRLHGRDVEAIGASDARFMPAEEHGLLEAVHRAYAYHYPLVLSPDAIWLAIAQGFAQHVNVNAERLRGKFVRHTGQATIRIQRDDFRKGSSENPWPEVFSAFSDAVAEHIGRQRDLVVCDFSTTGPCERAASEIVLLDAMKQYFRYELLTLCGIPEVTLEGTPDDWRSIRRRARVLEEYELGWWTAGLGPVLDQLVATAEGRIDVRFWETLFKDAHGSGGPYVQGWINVLFPYLKVDKEGTLERNAMVTEWANGFGKRLGGGPNVGMIPSGLSCVPFDWLYLVMTYPMELLGGFVGTAQDPATLALRPVIGWAVRDAVRDDAPRPRGKSVADILEIALTKPAASHGLKTGIVLLAGKILGEGEISMDDAADLDGRVSRSCEENGARLARAWVDLSGSGKPPQLSASFRLAVGVEVSAQSGSSYFFSIDDLRRALDAARAVPKAVWRALGEAIPGGSEAEPALYLVCAHVVPKAALRTILEDMPDAPEGLTERDFGLAASPAWWTGEVVYGSPAVLRSLRVAEATPTAPCAVIDVSPEAHAERAGAARELGVEPSAGRYKLG